MRIEIIVFWDIIGTPDIAKNYGISSKDLPADGVGTKDPNIRVLGPKYHSKHVWSLY